MTIAELLAKYADHPLMQVEASDLVEFSIDSWGDALVHVKAGAFAKYTDAEHVDIATHNGYTHWDCKLDGARLTACKANPPVSAVI